MLDTVSGNLVFAIACLVFAALIFGGCIIAAALTDDPSCHMCEQCEKNPACISDKHGKFFCLECWKRRI